MLLWSITHQLTISKVWIPSHYYLDFSSMNNKERLQPLVRPTTWIYNHEWHTKLTIIYVNCEINHKTSIEVIIPLRAKILESGFIRAESAVIGLLKGCIGMLISTITTLFWGDVSRTHIYFSDSIVTFVNVINCWLIPMLGNCITINPKRYINHNLKSSWNPIYIMALCLHYKSKTKSVPHEHN